MQSEKYYNLYWRPILFVLSLGKYNSIYLFIYLSTHHIVVCVDEVSASMLDSANFEGWPVCHETKAVVNSHPCSSHPQASGYYNLVTHVDTATLPG